MNAYLKIPQGKVRKDIKYNKMFDLLNIQLNERNGEWFLIKTVWRLCARTKTM